MERRYNVGDLVKNAKLNITGKITSIQKQYFDGRVICFSYIVTSDNKDYVCPEYQLKRVE